MILIANRESLGWGVGAGAGGGNFIAKPGGNDSGAPPCAKPNEQRVIPPKILKAVIFIRNKSI